MMYRLNIAQKNDKQKQREAFHQMIFDKKQELKQRQEAVILKAMDEISKREKVVQIKVNFFCFIFWYIFAVFMWMNSFKLI